MWQAMAPLNWTAWQVLMKLCHFMCWITWAMTVSVNACTYLSTIAWYECFYIVHCVHIIQLHVVWRTCGPWSNVKLWKKNAFKVLCSGVHVLAGERAFLFSKNVHTGSEAHPIPLLNWWLRESGLGAEVSMTRAIHCI